MLSINFMFILLVVSWISLYLNNRATVSPPKNCLTHNTLNDFINCLDAFTVSPNFYDTSSYATAQPTKEENSAWKSVVHSMLNTNADDCSDITLPSALAYIYAITAFHDADTTRTFCVLFETTASVYRNYTKGWGLMVVPASASAISRHIHLSAPHPQADINTPQQAAAIFVLSGAHSLLISGRLRSAYAVQTDCIVSAGSTKGYSKTDPTHDVDEPFSVANREIREWQNANGGCPSETCAYVQFHGKAASSCAADTMFISSGLGNSNSAISWYQDLSFDIPARRVRDIVRTVFPTWTASLPSDDPTCVLTATDNVFGRLINGVPDNSICTTEADSSIATGEFIHIEQAIVSRKSDVYDQWGEVLRRAFRAICAEGTVEDSKNGLCIDS
ncbi:hypothetical protein J3R30DRAFT_1095094 [Lentinula aciculospora]|uniref:Uncharacterized protein n=1 Tax=Lentinula aciculospora TaxID=153920 RepID=A0A9W9A238_9AGAR|nr:hypothetical protein J3R30DRAFT_1095094 [Lentinula aciculospora]